MIDKSSPLWMPDSAASSCLFCQREFSFHRRRHHCRSCGKIFCDDCCSARISLDGPNSERVRVCLVCCKRVQVSAVGSGDVLGDTLATLEPLLQLVGVQVSKIKKNITIYKLQNPRPDGHLCRVGCMQLKCTLEELGHIWNWNDLILWLPSIVKECKVVEQIGANSVVYVRCSFSKLSMERDFVFVSRRTDSSDQIMLVQASLPKLLSKSPRVFRGMLNSVLCARALENGETQVMFVGEGDPGGLVPGFAANLAADELMISAMASFRSMVLHRIAQANHSMTANAAAARLGGHRIHHSRHGHHHSHLYDDMVERSNSDDGTGISRALASMMKASVAAEDTSRRRDDGDNDRDDDSSSTTSSYFSFQSAPEFPIEDNDDDGDNDVLPAFKDEMVGPAGGGGDGSHEKQRIAMNRIEFDTQQLQNATHQQKIRDLVDAFNEDRVFAASKLLTQLESDDAGLKKILSSYPELATIKYTCKKFEEMKVLLTDDQGWRIVKESGGKRGTRVSHRKGDGDSLHTFRVEATLNAPILNVLLLLNEISLYSSWLAFLTRSEEVKRLHRSSRISIAEIAAPWPFANRDMLVHSTSADATEDPQNPFFFIYLQSLDEELAEDGWEARSGVCRLEIQHGAVIFEPCGENEVRISALVHIDPKINAPTHLINWAATQVLYWGTVLLERKANALLRASKESDPHWIKYKTDQELYVWLTQRLASK